MISGQGSKTSRLDRREFLRAGLAGFGVLSMADLMRFRAESPPSRSEPRTAVILVWMRGGMSHLDTWDPKPDAPSEYRGPYAPIATRVPGMSITELTPRLAQIADRFTLLRSVAHTGGGHPAGSLQVLGGDLDAQDKLQPVRPDFMTVAHYLRYDANRPMPNYVGVNPIVRYDSFTIAGPGYLGASYAPFAIHGDPSAPSFRVPGIGIDDPQRQQSLRDRVGLQQRFDTFRREIDQSGVMNAMDRFQLQALHLLTRPEAAIPFDLSREPNHVRDRYGRNAWGQQLLMARRLVEAGVEIITTTLDGPLCGRVANWDDHAVNQHVFDALNFRMPTFDQAVSALIEDIYARGLDRRVLVVVTGEFGRTPRITYEPSSGSGVASAAAGTVQPGRDHWPAANTMLWAGGGITTGQVIGSTDRRGEYVSQRRVGPQDFLATIYHHLGIDHERVTINDLTGRPHFLTQNGHAIPELLASR
ncbi:MAG TPA: DUF1501 domain-containing protein [Gemmataceae bacterium]|nr:DUF1501 domain-containing protein [Gemmataceae bacterium]